MRRDEKITYISDAGEIIFAVNRPLTPFWVDNVDGLDGLEVNLYTYKGSGQDGETLTAKNIQARNITITGQILDDPVTMRRRLLRAFNPKNIGRIIYEDEYITRWIPCQIRTTPIVTHEPVPNFQISLFCPNPYFRDGDGASQHVADIALWVPALSFPVEIPVEGMELEYRNPSLIVNVNNDGDVDAGFMVEFRALGATSNPSITNVNTQEVLSLTIDMQAGDIIRVSTGYAQKRAILTRGGAITNVFNAVDRASISSITGDWLHLHVGDNLLRYNATVPDNIEVTIYYDAAYLGV